MYERESFEQELDLTANKWQPIFNVHFTRLVGQYYHRVTIICS